jgi:excisionase family DNA binding protein
MAKRVKQHAATHDAKPVMETRRELLTVGEFARQLSISVWTARAWAYAGKISSCKIGARLQIPTSEITRLIADNLRPAVGAR